MKLPCIILGLASLGLLALVSGCSTFTSRAEEKSAVFDALSPGTQQRLERGQIAVGDSEDMVYISLGHPDEKRTVSSTDGERETWIYRTYWEQYEGSAWVGWRRIIVPSADRRRYVVFHEPVTRDVYRTRVDEQIRVTLANGRVESVDQTKR